MAVFKSSPVSILFLSPVLVHREKSLDNFLFLFTGNGKRTIIPHFPLVRLLLTMIRLFPGLPNLNDTVSNNIPLSSSLKSH